MTIAQVGAEWGNSGVGSGGTTLALPSHGDGVSTILTGDTIIVAAESAVASGVTAAAQNIVTSAGTATLGTWTRISTEANNNGTGRIEVWTAAIVAGGSVTITISPVDTFGTAVSSGINGSAWEFSGMKSSADVTLVANGSGTALASGTSGATAQGSELIFCANMWKSPTATFSPAPSFTPATTLNTGAIWNVTGADNSTLQVYWQIQGSSPHTEGFSGTLSASTNWGLCLDTFEQVGVDNSSSLQTGWDQPAGTSSLPYNGTLSATQPWAAGIAVYAETANTVPAQVTGLLGTAGDGNAGINWNTPANGGSALLSYTLEYFIAGVLQGTITGIPIADYSTATGTPYNLSGLINTDTYTAKVIAVNGVGSSPISAASNTFTPLSSSTIPGTPVAPSVSAGDTTATVTISPPSNGGSTLLTYTFNCYQGVTLFSTFTQPVAVGTQYTFTGLTDGVQYGFTNLATNGVGTSNEGPATLATPEAPVATISTWLPAPAGMYIPSIWSVLSWDTEFYIGGGLGEPPPAGSEVLVANVQMNGTALKVWQVIG